MPRNPAADSYQRLHVGIDLGTSGCRAIAINADGEVMAESSLAFPSGRNDGDRHEQDPQAWWRITQQVLATLLHHVSAAQVHSIAVDGTSGTLLLCDEQGEPCSAALMYNDARSSIEARQITTVAPQHCAAHGATSALAKLIYLLTHSAQKTPRYAMSQTDWINSRLCRRHGISDENNCLKLGYDVITRRWPSWLTDWFRTLGIDDGLLPRVVAPGTEIATIDKDIATRFGLSSGTRLLAGTTDGVAAFLATGARDSGAAVSSLGSTLIIKVLSDTPVFAPQYGVYSHRLGDRWLVGGASNCGGATLLQYFTPKQLDAMMPHLVPERPTGLDFYPLAGRGERFPVCDAGMQARLTPRPDDDVTFYQAMLEGIANVEARAYRLLAELGAPYPTSIRSVGGGAHNHAWQQIRRNVLNVDMKKSRYQQAAYGTALLARHQQNRISAQ